MTLAMAGYVINDVFIKIAAEDLPLFQAIFIRGFFITAVIGVWVIVRGQVAAIPRVVNPMILTRVAMEALSTAAFLTALTKLPLAPLTAVFQIVPLAVTFVAARLLREPVSIHRAGAVVAGFGGVLLIVKPWSEAFSGWYLLGLVAVALIVVRELVTRRIASDVPSLVVAFGSAVAITAMGLIVSLIAGWGAMDARAVGLLFMAAAFLSLGYVASVVTIRVGELSFSAPFRYTILLFAIILQIVVFREIPDALTFVGSGIIVVAGLWAFAHEQLVLGTTARPAASNGYAELRNKRRLRRPAARRRVRS